MDTYFTFADGALRYDCMTCRQRCCRGKGFAVSTDDFIPLLAKVPTLAPHLRLRRNGTFAATDLTEGCWFLQPSGMCAIEVEHGRDLKPSTCRLFPFNRVFRVGAVRVVDVNSMLCPVEAAGGDGVKHAELAAEIESLAGSPLVDTPAWTPLSLAEDWLTVERRVLAAACDPLVGGSADAFAAAQGAPEGESARLVAAWGRVYGVGGDELRRLEAEVAPSVALVAPSLRWNHLFRKDAEAYPRTQRALPRRLRALTFLAALARRSASPQRRETSVIPSLRGITELWQMESFALDVLCRWDEPVKLAAPGFQADVPPRLLGALGVLLGLAFRGGKTLGELVEAAAGALAPAERPLAVALAANQLDTLFPILAATANA